MLSQMAAVILAAGFGRLREGVSKLVEKIGDDALLIHVIRQATLAGFGKIVVVLNSKNQLFCDQIKEEIAQAGFQVEFAYQHDRLGPANAVLEAMPVLERSGIEQFVVLFGDMPKLHHEKILALGKAHLLGEPVMTVSSWKYQPGHKFSQYMNNYAYVYKNGCGSPLVFLYRGMPIADSQVLSSMYAFNRRWFKEVYPQILPYSKGDGYPDEIHLPRFIEVALVSSKRVVNLDEKDPETILGVNTLADHELLASLG